MISLLRVLRDAKNSSRDELSNDDSHSDDSSTRCAPLAMIAVYDAPTAALCCQAGADLLLVGDSLGNVVLGFDSTVAVTTEMMLHHTGAVVRGMRNSARQVPVLADLPFASYASVDDAIRHSAALMRAGAHGVKLEGAGENVLRAVRTLTEMGAPVVGHLGFTPQSSGVLNGVVQGKTAENARRLLESAQLLESAGCVALVLEAIPSEVAQVVTQNLGIPTIGIGAGAGCDGQVLVWHDLVGFSAGKPFRFVKRFANAHETLANATRDFVEEVHSGAFPRRENQYAMPDKEREAWMNER